MREVRMWGARLLLACLVVLVARPVVAQTDAVDLNTVVFHSRNVAAWPIATTLQGVEFKDADPQGGVRPILSAMPWPGIVPAGWDGPITYAIWLGRRVNGTWHIACALEFYDGKIWTGAPLHRQYNDWLSVGKGFGDLEGLPNPVPGEPLLFMVTHGSQRLKDTSTQPGPKSRAERSNVIQVPFAVNGVALAETPVTPPPVVAPPVVVPPVVTPPAAGPDYGPRVTALEGDVAAIQAALQQLASVPGEVARLLELLTQTTGRVEVIDQRLLTMRCVAAANIGVRIPISCRLE